MKTISIRIDERLRKEMEHLAKYTDKSSLIRKIMHMGLEQYKIELAVQRYMQGKASTWKAAEVAGVGLRRMMDILQERGIDMHYSEKSLREDMKW